ncbi:tRNA pseudouridine(38/39) synthase [Malassezia nana]|uniref:tRNA pseudouridine(38/39) synthase n=1 Tax=Malassezia nana TaxID=180528 RepID=A0AAF0EHI8_9BASI|nr:tRNA pseudouridine(38/39) synthase [Malassezia nana]
MKAQPCRKIALRFCYDGGQYSGLAAQTAQVTPLPTVEETLWEALCTARLVDASKSMDDAGWSRCGRTDAGVSAAGQVVAFWARSQCVDERHIRWPNDEHPPEPIQLRGEHDEELPYVATLNRLLPPSIRVQAWSPVRSDFSARFDCVYRHYKYFFTLGAPFSLSWQPEGASQFSGRLDVDAMREAASRLVGEHDFRNLCKVDASKQITNFVRRIDGATIDPVSAGWHTHVVNETKTTDTDEPMYVLNLRGSAFLYHQVRNIMAILFMVGAGLEHPQVVDELINVQQGAAAADRIRARAWVDSFCDHADAQTPDKLLLRSLPEPHPDLTVYETKPSYEMAADRPLMLWECGFRFTDVQWRASAYAGPMPPPSDVQVDYTPAVRATSQLHSLWTREMIHAELLRHCLYASMTGSATFLSPASTFEATRTPVLPAPVFASEAPVQRAKLVPLGNGVVRPTTRYTVLAARPRDVSAAEKNKKWREGKGLRRAERRAAAAPDEAPSATP